MNWTNFLLFGKLRIIVMIDLSENNVKFINEGKWIKITHPQIDLLFDENDTLSMISIKDPEIVVLSFFRTGMSYRDVISKFQQIEIDQHLPLYEIREVKGLTLEYSDPPGYDEKEDFYNSLKFEEFLMFNILTDINVFNPFDLNNISTLDSTRF